MKLWIMKPKQMSDARLATEAGVDEHEAPGWMRKAFAVQRWWPTVSHPPFHSM